VKLQHKSRALCANGFDTESMRLIACCLSLVTELALAQNYPPPRFTDPDRLAKMAAAFPDIDRTFVGYATEKHIPGMVWGIVVDGRLVHTGTYGVQDLTSKTPVTPRTSFRIASMTKSFTTLAILQLRDEGKLALDDPVAKWLPEFAHIPLPTRDSAPLRLRQLLSHSAGWPEDNPWGDQQLAVSDADMTHWLQHGIPFSTPPATRYEYSNYAFALLGRVVTKASGVPYEQYVRSHILSQLHMDSSTFRFSDVPVATRAIGYRLQPDGTYRVESPLPNGAFGSAGGLLTTADDLGKYVAFHLSAWPPRDDAEAGPVRRSSVREMSQMWTPANFAVRHPDGALQASESGYGFGLRVRTDCRFEHIVSHGGGLPGFGSYMEWLPDYGVGMFAMATLTYSGPSEPISRSWDAMLRTGGLQPRELPPSPLQTQLRDRIFGLWRHWDDQQAKEIAAVNFFIDFTSLQRRTEIQKLKDEVGACSAAGPVMPENWLRGQFNLQCERGTVGVFFTLSPTQPPAIQYLNFQRLANASTRLEAPTGPRTGVVCPE
jgi:CubicO group peptidase (beta-lactamase class C family)